MNVQSILLLLIIVALVVIAQVYLHRKHKKNGGHCEDCDANCPFRKK